MQHLFGNQPKQKAVPGAKLNMVNILAKTGDWLGQKLQRKLIVILALFLFVTSSAFLAIVIAVYKQQLVDEHSRASMQVNLLLQASLENAMLKRDIDGLRGIVGRLGRQDGIVGVAILNPDFDVRFRAGSQQVGDRLAIPVVKKP